MGGAKFFATILDQIIPVHLWYKHRQLIHFHTWNMKSTDSIDDKIVNEVDELDEQLDK